MYHDGLQAGKGVWMCTDGSKYEGDWRMGHRCDSVHASIPQRKRSCAHADLRSNVCTPPVRRHGEGTWTAASGSTYSGRWQVRVNNSAYRHNVAASILNVSTHAFFYCSSHSSRCGRHSAFLQNGAMTGRGTLSLPNGHQQSGEFREGVIWRGAWMVSARLACRFSGLQVR